MDDFHNDSRAKSPLERLTSLLLRLPITTWSLLAMAAAYWLAPLAGDYDSGPLGLIATVGFAVWGFPVYIVAESRVLPGPLVPVGAVVASLAADALIAWLRNIARDRDAGSASGL